MKFLKLVNGDLLNANEVKKIVKTVQLHRSYDDGGKRGIKAEIEIQTTVGRYTFIDVFAYAPMKEEEPWNYGTEGGCRAIRRIDDILDTMITVLVDMMNEEDEKIISIGTNFLEEAMQEEVDRG